MPEKMIVYLSTCLVMMHRIATSISFVASIKQYILLSTPKPFTRISFITLSITKEFLHILVVSKYLET